MGLVTHSYFAVKQNGEWRAHLLPGLRATKREAYRTFFVGHPSSDKNEGSESCPEKEADEGEQVESALRCSGRE